MPYFWSRDLLQSTKVVFQERVLPRAPESECRSMMGTNEIPYLPVLPQALTIVQREANEREREERSYQAAPIPIPKRIVANLPICAGKHFVSGWEHVGADAPLFTGMVVNDPSRVTEGAI